MRIILLLLNEVQTQVPKRAEEYAEGSMRYDSKPGKRVYGYSISNLNMAYCDHGLERQVRRKEKVCSVENTLLGSSANINKHNPAFQRHTVR